MPFNTKSPNVCWLCFSFYSDFHSLRITNKKFNLFANNEQITNNNFGWNTQIFHQFCFLETKFEYFGQIIANLAISRPIWDPKLPILTKNGPPNHGFWQTIIHHLLFSNNCLFINCSLFVIHLFNEKHNQQSATFSIKLG